VRRIRIPVVPSSEITRRARLEGRRRFLRAAAGGAAAALLPVAWESAVTRPGRLEPDRRPAGDRPRQGPQADDYADFTTYNNIRGAGRRQGSAGAQRPSAANSPLDHQGRGVNASARLIGIDDVLTRVSPGGADLPAAVRGDLGGVVPWVGVPLSAVLARFKPTSRAKFVELAVDLRSRSSARPAPAHVAVALRRGPANRRGDAPADAARDGCYGEVLPGPERRAAAARRALEVRLQSAKSIVRIPLRRADAQDDLGAAAAGRVRFLRERQPRRSNHPRWSQGASGRSADGLFARRRPTLMFNGYAAEVADLYRGMDLSRDF